MKVKFTKAELGQILTMIMHRDLDGWYYGNKAQFEKREQYIKKKVSILLMEANK